MKEPAALEQKYQYERLEPDVSMKNLPYYGDSIVDCGCSADAGREGGCAVLDAGREAEQAAEQEAEQAAGEAAGEAAAVGGGQCEEPC